MVGTKTSRNKQSSEVRESGEGSKERLPLAIGDCETLGVVKLEMFCSVRQAPRNRGTVDIHTKKSYVSRLLLEMAIRIRDAMLAFNVL